MSIPFDLEIARKALKTLHRDKIKAVEDYVNYIAHIRANCHHPNVTEVDYQPETEFMDSEAPERVCDTCGFREEGWGCGYKILANNKNRKVVEVPRKDLDKARGKYLSED